ncbi:hypothetical protein [Streptomyces hiroshimensis]|nr:hypothetical protein [Streptomyces hiroshimensis]
MTYRAYEQVYIELLSAAAHLDTVRRVDLDAVEPCATAAMHAVRFAVAILSPAVPTLPPPRFPDDTERLLQLAANWREAALGLGDFTPPRPDLRVVGDTAPPSKKT